MMIVQKAIKVIIINNSNNICMSEKDRMSSLNFNGYVSIIFKQANIALVFVAVLQSMTQASIQIKKHKIAMLR